MGDALLVVWWRRPLCGLVLVDNDADSSLNAVRHPYLPCRDTGGWITSLSSFLGHRLASSHSATVCSTLWNLILFYYFFLGPHPLHKEVPRLRVRSELELPAFATATTDPSHVCGPLHSSGQHQILNPLSEVLDGTCNLMIPSRIRFHCAMTGTPWKLILN